MPPATPETEFEHVPAGPPLMHEVHSEGGATVPGEPTGAETAPPEPTEAASLPEGAAVAEHEPVIAAPSEQAIPTEPELEASSADAPRAVEPTAADVPVGDPSAAEPRPVADAESTDDLPAEPPAEPASRPPARRKASAWSYLGVALRGGLRDQLGRILIGGGVGLLLLVGLVAFLPPTPHTGQAAQDVPQVAVPTPTPAPKTAGTPAATIGATTARTIVRQVAVLGAQAGLSAPQEAVQLRNGTIAVVDTGHKRLVLLDAHGTLLKSITAGSAAFKDPFAVATAGGTIYLLDAEGDTVDRFSLQGQYRGPVIRDPVLHHARGMALERNGNILVANPSGNSVLTIAPGGAIVHTLSGPVGAGPTNLDQPSDVAASLGGIIYILDNNNRRVQIVNAANAFTGRRPAPASSTIASAHVLPLPDGRLLVSDPVGALLLYPSGGGNATRIVLRVPGETSGHISPLGLALAAGGRVLITDTMGNRILVLPVSRL